MKTLILFSLALILTGFAQLEDPGRHINDIERTAQVWFDKAEVVRYIKIVHHETYETKEGGRVCYRAIHPAYVDVVCLGWDSGQIEHLESYRIR